MRKLLPLLFLASLLYAAWFYWQDYSDRPLQAPLLPLSEAEIQKITVSPANREAPFTLTRTDEGWAVARPPQQLLDQSLKAEALVTQLTSLTTDSVCYRPAKEAGIRIKIQSQAERTDELLLQQLPDGTLLATIPTTGDVFYLNPRSGNGIMAQLAFNHYREARLLNLRPEQVDSVEMRYRDSLLWRADSLHTPLLANHLLAPAAAPFADYFDEIAHRDRYAGEVNFYFSGRAHRVEVYQDSLWPRPFVLVGEDYPRRYLGFDKIPMSTAE